MSRSFPRLNCLALELRSVPAILTPLTDSSLIIAPEDGGVPRVKIIDPRTGEDIGEIEAYPDSFRGGVRAATGDVTGDGTPDVVTGTGVGGGPVVRVFDGRTGAMVRSFFAYPEAYHGGINVGVGDFNRDGFDDIIVGTGKGGGPVVRVFDGQTGVMTHNFFAYPEAYHGGVNVAAGDVNRDGFDDIIAGTGQGGGPVVRAFDGRTGVMTHSFFAYPQGFEGGVNVTVADVTGDGNDDIVAGAGVGGGPVVRVFDTRSGETVRSFFADDSTHTGGVRVSAHDVTGDGIDDLLPRTRHGSDVAGFVFDGVTGSQVQSFIRKVDDHPSASDLIQGSGRNNGNSTTTPATTVTKLEGTITAVSVASRTVTLRVGTRTQVVPVAAGAKIERNDIETALDAFRVGDFGQARLDASGTATKIEAVG